MTPTIKDVAEKCNVAHTTASDILNRGRAGIYAEKTVARVRETADRLGYRANYFAASLKTGRTNLIGVKGAADGYWGLFHPYLTKVFSGITGYFRENHPEYKFIFQEFEDPSHRNRDEDLVQRRLVDGLLFIILSRSIKAFVKYQLPVLKKTLVPFTAIHSHNRTLPCANVGVDCETAGYLGTRHLIEHGYTTVGFIPCGSADNLHETELGKGYRRACREAGIPCGPEWTWREGGYTTEEGVRCADHMLASKRPLPRALFITNDAAAYGLIHRLREKGISVPDDLAVLSFGDDVNQTHVITDLTAVTQPAYKKGYLAAEMLCRQFKKPDSPGREDFMLIPPQLVVRKTCGCKS